MKIYKYTPHINQFLQSSMLKMTPIRQLNDPFEITLTEDALQDFGNKYDKEFGINSSELLSNIRENHKFTGVISFSIVTKSIPMLAHYADSFRGGILEFTIDGHEKAVESLLKNRDIELVFGEVAYIENRPREFYLERGRNLSRDLSFQKHRCWKDEKEVRLVGDFRKADYISIVNNHRFATHLTDPYPDGNNTIGSIKKEGEIDISWNSRWSSLIKSGEIFHPLVEINSASLTAIYLGCRFPLQEICNDNLDKFQNLKGNIFASKVDQNKYVMEFSQFRA